MTDVSLVVPAVVVVAGLAAGLVARRLLVSRLSAAAARTANRVDDALIAALAGPVVPWGVLLGLHVAARVTDLPAAASRLLPAASLTVLVGSVAWVVGRLVSDLLTRAISAYGLPSATLVPHAVRLCVLLLGGLVVLQTLGISVTPLLTALGVGGLAVALALQDTLANLFAGVHVLASRLVRPGDFVRLESGEDGFVEDVTWRYTTIRRLAGNLTAVPNAKLASAVTTNFSLPASEMSVVVALGVAYGSDLSVVERVTVDVASEVLREVEGGVPGFEPLARFTGFGDSAVELVAILRARDYVSQFLLKHEFLKRLHRRYAAEGIEIPFPVRTVQLQLPEGRPRARGGRDLDELRRIVRGAAIPEPGLARHGGRAR